MSFDELKVYLLNKRAVSEETPFGPDTLVYKVRGKIFALVAWRTTPLRVSLKCRPARALALRAEFAAVEPGYHLNKRHWNTLVLDGTLPQALVYDLIDESYELVVRNLPKSEREGLI